MDTLTEEFRLYALNLATDERFTDSFLTVPNSFNEHYQLSLAAAQLRRNINYVNEFFVCIKN